MTYQPIKTAGEVAVNSMDALSEFERKSVNILRYADRLYDVNDFSGLPDSIQSLFYERSTRNPIGDLLYIFTMYYLRPIVRHQPGCPCVGADENVFANILRFSVENLDNEVMILGSLLIKPQQVGNLVKKAKVVAHLIIEDLQKNLLEPKLTQNFHNHLH
jgi:hypothetical protein